MSQMNIKVHKLDQHFSFENDSKDKPSVKINFQTHGMN